MKIFSAIGKHLLRTINDSAYNKDLKSAQQTAYKNTGKAIEQAKKSGNHINASLRYKHELTEAKRLAQQKWERRNHSISDI